MGSLSLEQDDCETIRDPEPCPKAGATTTSDSEEKIVYEPQTLSEAELSGSTKHEENGVGAKPKRTNSSNFPEPVPKDDTDPTKPVKADIDLPEPVEHTESQERAGGRKPQKVAVSDSYEDADASGSPPEYPRNRRQPSNTEGYQPVASPMSSEQTDRVTTVTPLRLLGEQSDLVDCPFCRRQVETRIEKKASRKTYIIGTALCLTTLLATFVPCYCKWFYDVDHRCTNCGRIVAHWEHDKEEAQVFGTPEHLKEASRYPAASPRPLEEKSKRRGKDKDINSEAAAQSQWREDVSGTSR